MDQIERQITVNGEMFACLNAISGARQPATPVMQAVSLGLGQAGRRGS
jgi:hypothetical protein